MTPHDSLIFFLTFWSKPGDVIVVMISDRRGERDGEHMTHWGTAARSFLCTYTWCTYIFMVVPKYDTLAHWNLSTHLQMLIYMYMYKLHVWHLYKCVYTHTWLNIRWKYCEYINVHVHIYYLIYPYLCLGTCLHVFEDTNCLCTVFPILRSKKDRMNILKFLLLLLPGISLVFLDTKQFCKGFPWKPRRHLGIPISSSCVSQVVWIWWWSSCWSCILAETRICGGKASRGIRAVGSVLQNNR